MLVLVVGATGSIGRLVVNEAIRQGYSVRALVRNSSKASRLPLDTQVVIGDVTQPDTLPEAVNDVDAIVFTLGADSAGKIGAEGVNYGGVRNVLNALGSRKVRIALMSSIGVTDRTASYNRTTEGHDWKRRAERLVRASGLPYTIVRPGWFDMNGPDQKKLVFLRGDRRQSGTPTDGAVARSQIAEVLVRSLTSDPALRKSFELISADGPATKDFEALFAPLEADVEGALDAVRDTANMPLDQEPARLREDLEATAAHRTVRSGAA